MSSFFEDTMTGLIQAVSIERGNIVTELVPNMPAPTYREKGYSKEEAQREAAQNS